MNKLPHFERNGRQLPVSFVETMLVKAGVSCDVYTFPDDASMDLGVVEVTRGGTTPLQRVLNGIRTIEGFMAGCGVLTITGIDGTQREYQYPCEDVPAEVEVRVGETMQWRATTDNLTFYEICEPPYEDGRYENLSE